MNAPDPFRPAAAEGAGADPVLTVDLDGFEGPLDLLLTLARAQKVDLRRISILALAEQYLRFVEAARRLRIELAADYLVMAAWLAYLKSRLLLPAAPADGDEPTAEELAARLAWRLERLEAMRGAAAALADRARLGRERLPCGAPAAPPAAAPRWQAGIGDLLAAYARLRTRAEYRPLQIERDAVFEIEAALERLSRLMGGGPGWSALESFLPPEWCACPRRRRSALAASFAASLELCRQGRVELRQDRPFGPLMLRPRPAP